MLAIIYKNIIENKKSLLLGFGGIVVFMFAVFFMSLAIDSGSPENNAIVKEIMYFLGVIASYFVIGSAQPTIISCDYNSRFCSFILSAPNGRLKFIAAKYAGMLLIGAAETMIFLLVAILIEIDLNPTVIVTMTFIQLLLRAIEAPFMVRFGAKTGQNVKGCIVGVLMGACFIYTLYGDNTFFTDGIDYSTVIELLTKLQNDEGFQRLILFGFCGGTLVLYVASILISTLVIRKGITHLSDSQECE